MNKRRLLKLADLLDADAKNKKGIKFNMFTFGRVTNEDAPLSCGTQACAMGLAALSGSFKRVGLSAYFDNSDDFFFEWQGHRTGNGFRVAVSLFNITRDEAGDLFGIGSVPGGVGATAERALAKRIRDFVKIGNLR